MANVLQQQLLNCFKWISNQLLNRNISLLFFQTCVLINSISLCFDLWIFCHPLANLSLSFWLFLVLFWMLVTVHKLCHVPHASRITTWAAIFTERLFSLSKLCVRSWSHVFFITYNKTFAKNLLAVRPKKGTEGKKKKSTRIVIAKLFELNANAKISFKQQQP